MRLKLLLLAMLAAFAMVACGQANINQQPTPAVIRQATPTINPATIQFQMTELTTTIDELRTIAQENNWTLTEDPPVTKAKNESFDVTIPVPEYGDFKGEMTLYIKGGNVGSVAAATCAS